MKKIVLSIAVIALLVFITDACPIELTLQDCIQLALKNNNDLKAYGMDAFSKSQEVKISRTEFLPSMRLQGGYSFRDRSDYFLFERHVFGPGIPPENVKFSTENQNTYGVNLVLEQPVFTGGYLTHSLKRSKLMSQEARYEIEKQQQLLVLDVKKSYYQVLREQYCLETQEKLLESKKARITILQEQYTEGYIPKEDILQVEADLAFAELDCYQTRNRKNLALRRLKELMVYQEAQGGQKDQESQEGDEISLQGRLLNGSLTASLQEVKEAARRNREELAISLLRVKSAEENIKLEESGFYPHISLKGSYNLQKETRIDRPQVVIVSAWMDWSLFEWGQTRAEVIRAKAVRDGLRYKHEQLQRAIMTEVEEAWMTVKEKEKLIQAQEKKLAAAECRLDTVRDKFSEGKAKPIDITEMETELARVYTEYIGAVADLDIALARLETSISFYHDEWFSTKEIYKPKS
ncbi:MAG: TolC family protein [bacterium]